jgi:hypothetical protein
MAAEAACVKLAQERDAWRQRAEEVEATLATWVVKCGSLRLERDEAVERANRLEAIEADEKGTDE